jgi:hypothetical protein
MDRLEFIKAIDETKRYSFEVFDIIENSKTTEWNQDILNKKAKMNLKGPITTKEHVKEVVKIAERINDANAALKKELGITDGMTHGSPESREYMMRSRDIDREMDNYLNILDDEIVLKLMSLMYFGRDPEGVHENDLEEYHQDLKKMSSKKDAIRSITEKMLALPRYFRDALSKCEILGIDPDTFKKF